MRLSIGILPNIVLIIVIPVMIFNNVLAHSVSEIIKICIPGTQTGHSRVTPNI